MNCIVTARDEQLVVAIPISINQIISIVETAGYDVTSIDKVELAEKEKEEGEEK